MRVTYELIIDCPHKVCAEDVEEILVRDLDDYKTPLSVVCKEVGERTVFGNCYHSVDEKGKLVRLEGLCKEVDEE